MTGRWIEIADGVLARRHAELDQTLGLVVGGEGCLVVDTGTDEVHGAGFAAAVREVTALPWTVLVTHSHWDHFFGTAPFLPCPVWAHPGCRADMAESAQEQRDTWAAWYRDAGKPDLADRLAAAELVLPDRAVAGEVELDLGGRVVTLAHPGRGHTTNDVVAHVPDAGVLFAGDLVEQGAPPAIGPDSDLPAWPSTVDALLARAPRVVVPGHGDPVDAAFVRGQRDELAAVAALARAVRSGELTEPEALARSPYPEDATLPALRMP